MWTKINAVLDDWQDPDLPPYVPGPEQWDVHLDDNPLMLIGGGEGGGKTRTITQEMVFRVLMKKARRARYWLIGADYEAARPEFTVLLGLLQAAGALPTDDTEVKSLVRMGETANVPWIMRLQGEHAGVDIRTRSVKDFTKIRSWALDGALACEVGLLPEQAFNRIITRIKRDKWRDGWLLASGTYEETQPWFPSRSREWQRDESEGVFHALPSWTNRYLYPGGRQDDTILGYERQYTRGYFMQRFAGIPVQAEGVVFKDYDERVHPDRERATFREWLPPDDNGERRRWPVYLCIDPSKANYAIIAAQVHYPGDGSPIVMGIDEVWGHGVSSHAMITECQKRPWWSNVERARPGVMDVAGKQSHGTDSNHEVWARLTGMRFRTRHVEQHEGIDRLSTFLRDPDIAFDFPEEPTVEQLIAAARFFAHPRCRNLLEEFGRLEWDDDDPLGRNKPIDKYNHGLKALWYFLVDTFGFVGAGRLRRRRRKFRMSASPAA